MTLWQTTRELFLIGNSSGNISPTTKASDLLIDLNGDNLEKTEIPKDLENLTIALGLSDKYRVTHPYRD